MILHQEGLFLNMWKIGQKQNLSQSKLIKDNLIQIQLQSFQLVINQILMTRDKYLKIKDKYQPINIILYF
ncbi:unnamed protein product [Paramecium sonneborni]|uniref:Uncharacterized protein n=1 Tax=Paramecium sonneborni TaxID=65129 RepID=A0A8S1RBV2_9CILI|nr:unnamed protein product [Paramecium sonneborni]